MFKSPSSWFEMKQKLKAELVAPCGMNCGVCKGYLAYSRNLPAEIRKARRTSYCAGCRPRGKLCAYIKGNCSKLRKQTIQFCYECEDFPCQRLQTIDRRYRTRYNTSLIDNLNQIKQFGIDEFLEKEEVKWRCSRCGGTISIHNSHCYDCE